MTPIDAMHELFERICEIELKKGDEIRKVYGPLSDAKVLTLAAYVEYRAGANSGRRGYRMHEWDMLASRLRGEVELRGNLRDARASGRWSYCPVCKGACDGEEQHHENALRLYGKDPDEMAVRELSIEQLVCEVLRGRRARPRAPNDLDAWQEGKLARLLAAAKAEGRRLDAPEKCSCWDYTMVGYKRSAYWPCDADGLPTGHHPLCELYEPPPKETT